MINQQELQGSWNQIKGLVKERWGQLTDNDLAMAQGSETAQEYMRNASDSISNGYEDLSNRVQRGYNDTKDMVQRSPAESVAVAFGAGILTGIVAALLLRSSRY